MNGTASAALHYAFRRQHSHASSPTMNRKPDPYGRDATRPYHIPLKGWWQVAERVWSESNRDNQNVVIRTLVVAETNSSCSKSATMSAIGKATNCPLVTHFGLQRPDVRTGADRAGETCQNVREGRSRERQEFVPDQVASSRRGYGVCPREDATGQERTLPGARSRYGQGSRPCSPGSRGLVAQCSQQELLNLSICPPETS